MALTFVVTGIQNLWPLSLFKFDDVRDSNRLVRKLAIPEHTKEFVFAIREPDAQSVIYILCVQNLSERSACDVDSLIREIKPDAVLAQVDNSAFTEMEPMDDKELLPTSSFGVLKRSFIDKIGKEKYENAAGNFVLKEIFGTSFHGNLLAAKKTAKEVGASFLILDSAFRILSSVDSSLDEVDNSNDTMNMLRSLGSSLVSEKMSSVALSGSRRLFRNNDGESQVIKVINMSRLKARSSNSTVSDDIVPVGDYEVPEFAQSFYPLLEDLHKIFIDLPSIGRSLAFAQKLLIDVNQGETVDSEAISEVCTFRIAVEGLRIALNNSGRLPINKIVNSKSKIQFSELSDSEKSNALLAQAIRSQTKKFKTIIAVVDASSLAGIRRQWNSDVPLQVKDLVSQLVIDCETDEDSSVNSSKKRLFTKKQVVAVGAGATAVVGASSLSKAVPVSTFMKIVSQKAIALGKILGPSKVKGICIINKAASAEKIGTITHGVIASAQKTSLSAIRTAFYEIMRKRRVQPIAALPWATLCFSVTTCTGLLKYGDGIECAAESLPIAASIANLGRGIQSLRDASRDMKATDRIRMHKSIESLMYALRNVKIQ